MVAASVSGCETGMGAASLGNLGLGGFANSTTRLSAFVVPALQIRPQSPPQILHLSGFTVISRCSRERLPVFT